MQFPISILVISIKFIAEGIQCLSENQAEGQTNDQDGIIGDLLPKTMINRFVSLKAPIC
jgi:hypothetical protein